MTMSLLEIAASMLGSKVAPASTAAWTPGRDTVRFQAVTALLAFTSSQVTAEPMLPIPRKVMRAILWIKSSAS